MQPTKEEIRLAPATVEALERLGQRECPECKGQKYRSTGLAFFGSRTCYDCLGTGKVGGWEWEPKRGEFAQIGMGMIVLVDRDGLFENKFVETSDMGLIEIDRLTPILHWETIEEILEKAGYYFEEPIKRVYGSEGSKYHCVIKKLGNPKPLGMAWGKSRQLAVKGAVIELRKEMEK